MVALASESLASAGDGTASKASWQGWRPWSLSLRMRLFVLVALINLAVIATAAWLLVSNARQAVQVETLASLELAKRLVLTAIGTLDRSQDAESLFDSLRLHFQQERHVRITLLDGWGELRSAPQITAEESDTPAWFEDLLRPPVKFAQIPIRLDARSLGAVIVTAEPADEIAEVWEDFSDLMMLMASALGLQMLLVHLAAGRALKPLAEIKTGLEQLEHGAYEVRLGEIAVPDLAPIGQRFNALASTLQTATAQTEKLSQQLVTLQDTERKNLAYELHDEIGPCLFGITVDARAIAAKARTLGPVDAAELAERAQAILDIVAHMQEHSRGLLYRLRPMALGEVSLSRLLDDLIERFRQREPQVAWLISLPDELTSCGETVDLTLYRMIQECLTNAARHACATRIEVTLAMLDPPAEGAPGSAKSQLELCVSDNGRGIPVGTPPGLGLTGMSQRVRALGGRFAVMARPGGGTIVRACIPVELLELADLDNMGSPRLDEGLS